MQIVRAQACPVRERHPVWRDEARRDRRRTADRRHAARPYFVPAQRYGVRAFAVRPCAAEERPCGEPPYAAPARPCGAERTYAAWRGPRAASLAPVAPPQQRAVRPLVRHGEDRPLRQWLKAQGRKQQPSLRGADATTSPNSAMRHL